MILKISIGVSPYIDLGSTISIVGYVVVFFALLLLYSVFKAIPKLIDIKMRRKLHKEGKIEDATSNSLQLPGDELAAISMALYLHLYKEVHDEENMIITLERVQRRYSPWSSKVYNLNKFRK